MYRLEFILHTTPLTLNEVMSKGWKPRHFNFEKVKDEIRLLTLGKRPEAPIKKASVYIRRFSPRKLDRDNFIFTFKPILDGLVGCGIIEDDGFDQVKRIDGEQVKCGAKEARKIEVIVEECQ